jgi:hypothetical protein
MPTGIISGKSYRIVNKGAHLALDFDTGNHKSILGDNPEPVETQAVRITFPVSTYCSTHVLVVISSLELMAMWRKERNSSQSNEKLLQVGLSYQSNWIHRGVCITSTVVLF